MLVLILPLSFQCGGLGGTQRCTLPRGGSTQTMQPFPLEISSVTLPGCGPLVWPWRSSCYYKKTQLSERTRQSNNLVSIYPAKPAPEADAMAGLTLRQCATNYQQVGRSGFPCRDIGRDRGVGETWTWAETPRRKKRSRNGVLMSPFGTQIQSCPPTSPACALQHTISFLINCFHIPLSLSHTHPHAYAHKSFGHVFIFSI